MPILRRPKAAVYTCTPEPSSKLKSSISPFSATLSLACISCVFFAPLSKTASRSWSDITVSLHRNTASAPNLHAEPRPRRNTAARQRAKHFSDVSQGHSMGGGHLPQPREGRGCSISFAAPWQNVESSNPTQIFPITYVYRRRAIYLPKNNLMNCQMEHFVSTHVGATVYTKRVGVARRKRRSVGVQQYQGAFVHQNEQTTLRTSNSARQRRKCSNSGKDQHAGITPELHSILIER